MLTAPYTAGYPKPSPQSHTRASAPAVAEDPKALRVLGIMLAIGTVLMVVIV